MISALATEGTKFVHANVARATTIIMVLGIALICSSMLLVVKGADPQLAAKLGPLVDPGGWDGYMAAAAAQVTADGSLLGYGVALSWMFGREFADGTITGLFALPVSRSTIVTAKFLIYGLWTLLTSVALLATLTLSGMAFGLGPPPPEAIPAMLRQFVLTVLTAAIAAPVAWVATIARSIVAGIGAAIGILVLTQVAVITGAGAWFTFSAPGLWAISGGNGASLLQLMLVIPLVLASAGLAVGSWSRLQLDR